MDPQAMDFVMQQPPEQAAGSSNSSSYSRPHSHSQSLTSSPSSPPDYRRSYSHIHNQQPQQQPSHQQAPPAISPCPALRAAGTAHYDPVHGNTYSSGRWHQQDYLHHYHHTHTHTHTHTPHHHQWHNVHMAPPPPFPALPFPNTSGSSMPPQINSQPNNYSAPPSNPQDSTLSQQAPPHSFHFRPPPIPILPRFNDPPPPPPSQQHGHTRHSSLGADPGHFHYLPRITGLPETMDRQAPTSNDGAMETRPQGSWHDPSNPPFQTPPRRAPIPRVPASQSSPRLIVPQGSNRPVAPSSPPVATSTSTASRRPASTRSRPAAYHYVNLPNSSDLSSDEDAELSDHPHIWDLIRLEGLPDGIHAQQILRGLVSGKRVASRSALASLQSVDISTLDESERTCVICYNDFGVENPEGINEAPLRLPKCKHVFGDHCIKKWFEDSDSCPYCRDKVHSEPQGLSSASNSTLLNFVREGWLQSHSRARRHGNDHRPQRIPYGSAFSQAFSGSEGAGSSAEPQPTSTWRRTEASASRPGGPGAFVDFANLPEIPAHLGRRSPPLDTNDNRRRTRARRGSLLSGSSSLGTSSMGGPASTSPQRQSPSREGAFSHASPYHDRRSILRNMARPAQLNSFGALRPGASTSPYRRSPGLSATSGPQAAGSVPRTASSALNGFSASGPQLQLNPAAEPFPPPRVAGGSSDNQGRRDINRMDMSNNFAPNSTPNAAHDLPMAYSDDQSRRPITPLSSVAA